ncbi:MAG: SLBB domain-containing protein [Vicinamibacteria bacterium]|nr:SLBB domain-containing protein [Vicinamibacteria bacterium]
MDAIERLGRSGLRGRGGAWFPAARKWQAVKAEGGEAVVVANGAEGEPGSIKDRFTMLRRPDAVLAGLRAAAEALGAREAHVYLKGSFAAPAAALEAALATVPAGGPEIRVHRGEDSYVAGEETALLESIEGRRAWPRPKPPRPFAVGLHGRPTLVQNVETLSRVPEALADPEAFRAGETTLCSIWGDVALPGVHEVRLGTPLRDVIASCAGGAPDGIGLLFPAGPSAPPLSAVQADLPLDPDALRAAGSALGTASLLVVGASRCPLQLAVSLAGFFEREACGQCPPCTVGTARLAGILRDLEAGSARGRDLHYLREAAGFMQQHGYCAHARTGATAALGLLARFPEAVEAHVGAGGCPHGGTPCDPFAPGSPQQAAIEAALGAA